LFKNNSKDYKSYLIYLIKGKLLLLDRFIFQEYGKICMKRYAILFCLKIKSLISGRLFGFVAQHNDDGYNQTHEKCKVADWDEEKWLN